MKKFNWIDGIIILLVFVLGAGVWARFGGTVERTTAKTSEFTYKVDIQRVRQQSIDALYASVGAEFNMEDKARTDDMGTLVALDVRPAMREVELLDGHTVLSEVPKRFDATLTLSLRGNVNDYGFFTPQLSNIGAGAKVTMKSKYAKIQGNIAAVLK
ncbi:MAG: DUF4330 domain-containing protein [Clostridiales bacterium]|jgi:hypothetical protein|nr:DUF4330 domain-containing protein [Clostridiales bacterium]